MLSRARLDPNDAAQREILGAPIADRDLRRPIRTNADGDLTGRSASLEQNDVVEASRDNILIGEAARRADAQLPMSKASVESDADVGRFTGAIFDRQRIHGTGRVRVASVWGEDRSAHNDTPDRAGERRDPPAAAAEGDRVLPFARRNHAVEDRRRPAPRAHHGLPAGPVVRLGRGSASRR